jgi:hypothetical protein
MYWTRPLLNSTTLYSIWQSGSLSNSKAKSFSCNIFQRKGNTSVSKFTTCVTNKGIHMTWGSLYVRLHRPPLELMTTHSTVRILAPKSEGAGHKFLWANFFLTHNIWRHKDQENKCMWNSVAQSIGHALTSKQNWNGVTWVRIRGGWTANVWQDKRECYKLSNISTEFFNTCCTISIFSSTKFHVLHSVIIFGS